MDHLLLSYLTRFTHQEEIYPIEIKLQIKKPNRTSCGLHDATLGSSAVFFRWKYGFNQGQQQIPRPAAFRPHLAMGLALAILWLEKKFRS
jgi:hypothetical protein